ncbi:hypothetical protein CONCODRAFT_5772 [Conidiobolus coronatus NRRL 28638]|uniref:RNI-like protein n=1 Tax=Conidiobolus coronatus (strain ATCC 28846 / CBS 209.66 / NRRL 28638) TaxID=796925 RepID=A0A137P929_CONC2|nr:hypothetical protein CONCODRAFT_5772 [Conidiobolus coronatus NRRL 28638]|eukprot:KXN71516.1 hypothetical protein CONCODRAFT_5772 [Conidiobolus coronatus NRRL 28638]
MDGKGWKAILSNYDTVKYLSKFELIELISYDQDLSNHVHHVKSLTYEYYHNNLLLRYISQIFYNLNRLHLSESSFTLTAFQKLMSDLNQLEHLILNRTLFIVFDTSNDPIILSLPPNLITFRPKSYLEIGDRTNIEDLKLKVESNSLPNLKYLEIDHYFQDFIETGSSLLAASRNLKHLSARYCLIERFSGINIQSLRSLTITMINQHYQSNVDAIFPTFRNLKELKIFAGFGINVFERGLIIPRLQKLANIAKNIEKLTLPYIKSSSFSIKDTLQNFDNLKELSLVPADKLTSLNPEELPKTINILNLYNTNPNFVDINNFSNCSELRTIAIYYNSQTLNNFKFEKSGFYKGFEGWRIINYPGASIRCYKE